MLVQIYFNMKVIHDKLYNKFIVINDNKREIFKGTEKQANNLLRKLAPPVDPFRNWKGNDKETKSRKGLIYFA